jgi:hypothetical protein
MTGTADESNQKVVCILGMHRSGTSALTRIVNLIGVDLGFQRSLAVEPAHDNAKGHWEHNEIALINETIIRRYGGSWHEPPILPAGWETSPALDDLRNDARKLLQNEFANLSLWGWKDPRTCLTLPFWQQLLTNVHYILCLRNPVDVASSLEHRDRFPAEKSFYLWLTYVSSALKYTEGKPRVVVFYEDIIDNSAPELNRLAEFLGRTERAGQTDVQAKVKAFIERELQHHSAPALDTTFNSTAERSARAIYLAERISVNLSLKRSIAPVYAALEALNLDSFRTPDNANHVISETELKSLSTQLLEKDLIVQRLSAQLEEQARVLASHAESAEASARKLSEQLRQKELELEQIKDTLGFRLLSRCWHIKQRYFLPLFRRSGSSN